MGVWGAGNFDNDWARDWIGDLLEQNNPVIVRDALNQAIHWSKPLNSSFIRRIITRQSAEPYLIARVASKALAAAEVVACWLGHSNPKLPEGIAEWSNKNSKAFSPEYVQLARQAIIVIKTKSELKDLWEEGDASEWYQVIQDLDRRLQN
ncbi:MAG: DUF4259 domain-containing protein [Limisphaerales bacterium]